jgi:hypothetical protein
MSPAAHDDSSHALLLFGVYAGVFSSVQGAVFIGKMQYAEKDAFFSSSTVRSKDAQLSSPKLECTYFKKQSVPLRKQLFANYAASYSKNNNILATKCNVAFKEKGTVNIPEPKNAKITDYQVDITYGYS